MTSWFDYPKHAEETIDRMMDRWFYRMRWVIYAVTFALICMGLASLAVVISTIAYVF